MKLKNATEQSLRDLIEICAESCCYGGCSVLKGSNCKMLTQLKKDLKPYMEIVPIPCSWDWDGREGVVEEILRIKALKNLGILK